MANEPLISIITVVYNGENGIEETIKSVLSQTYVAIEYIIIDGKSTDRTMQIIHQYEDQTFKIISEEDTGIYDAMNKGISLVTGDWIYFLNVGDQLFSKETIANIFRQEQTADLVYGNHRADYGYFQRLHIPSALSNLRYGMIFSHQGMFVKTQLMKEHPFNLNYELASDYNFIYCLYKAESKFDYIDEPIAVLKAGGVSEKRITKTHSERRKISCSYEKGMNKVGLRLSYFFRSLNLYLIKFVKAVLPKKARQRLTMRKYKG